MSVLVGMLIGQGRVRPDRGAVELCLTRGSFGLAAWRVLALALEV